MTPETAMAQTLTDELRRFRTPEEREQLALSYEEDAEKLERMHSMQFWAPLYRKHAANLRAGSVNA